MRHLENFSSAEFSSFQLFPKCLYAFFIYFKNNIKSKQRKASFTKLCSEVHLAWKGRALWFHKTVIFHYAADESKYKNFKKSRLFVSTMDIAYPFEVSQWQCKMPIIMPFQHIGNLHRGDIEKHWDSLGYLHTKLFIFSVTKSTFIILTTGISFVLIFMQFSETATIAVSVCERKYFCVKEKARLSAFVFGHYFTAFARLWDSSFQVGSITVRLSSQCRPKKPRGTGSFRDDCKLGKFWLQR